MCSCKTRSVICLHYVTVDIIATEHGTSAYRVMVKSKDEAMMMMMCGPTKSIWFWSSKDSCMNPQSELEVLVHQEVTLRLFEIWSDVLRVNALARFVTDCNMKYKAMSFDIRMHRWCWPAHVVVYLKCRCSMEVFRPWWVVIAYSAPCGLLFGWSSRLLFA